ncbi:hypothetical protein BGZ80_009857 [Entomortierella chlamydospora]|uniref:F-box domain-containing protein n=1 Tax=Entomortierella chlamydospora TaxID=101097 RepID=A0A9P6N482_9FUNG|nr:hypothetical protein BGZ79_000459 [Entomortierella chlamydospora]KAG0023287.1 hypothetical protein BGZ80_009857 [Entomortierella chlamydospora]
MTTTVPIFEIPHIVDLIATNLPLTSIRNCNLVCRDWHQTFSRHIWKDIFFGRKCSVKQVQFNSEVRRSLKSSAPYVSSLTTYYASLFWLLQLDPPKNKYARKLDRWNALTPQEQEQRKNKAKEKAFEAKSLKYLLEITATDSQLPIEITAHSAVQTPTTQLLSSSPSSPEHIFQPYTFSHLTTLRSLGAETSNPYIFDMLAIVEASPRLVTLEIKHFVLRDAYISRLATVIGAHPSLKEFSLTPKKYINDRNFLLLLQSFSRLERLTLHCNLPIGKIDPTMAVKDPLPITTTSLTYLDLGETLLWTTENVLVVPFLERSPKLKRILFPRYFKDGKDRGISSTIKTHLHDLCHLDFSNTRVEERIIAAVIRACHVLESFKGKGGFYLRNDVVDALLEPRHTMTLKSICFVSCPNISGTQLQRILRSCPNLDVFHAMDMDHTWHCLGSDPVIRVTDLKANPGWACHGLRVLALQYAETDEELFPKVIYDQISELEQLEVLFIKRFALPTPVATPVLRPTPAPTLAVTTVPAATEVVPDIAVGSSTTESTTSPASPPSGELARTTSEAAIATPSDDSEAPLASDSAQLQNSDRNNDNSSKEDKLELSKYTAKEKNLAEGLARFHSLQKLRVLDLTNLYQYFHEGQRGELKAAIPTLGWVYLY